MGFWSKLFGGSNQPDSAKGESVGVDPTTDKKMKPQQSNQSDLEQAKYSGRSEDTKAQRQADPETRKIVADAEKYPKEAETRQTGGSTEAAVGKQNTPKSREEKLKTQPKPGAEQRTTPKEAEPGSGKTKAGQHHEKD
ncbi:MAG: hypothetical protein JJU03_03315 [Idiomarina sp.]|nr:hypothetical protein [Idiomarina sp.]